MQKRLYSIMLSILLFAALVFAQSKGGRWQFENNGFDTADWDAAEDTGALQPGAVFGSQPPLMEGVAYLLLDTTAFHDFFKVDDSNDLDFHNENIGISAWIYPYVLNDVHFLVNKGVQNANPKTTNYALRIATNKKLEFLIRDANNQAKKVTSSFTIPENSWTFVAAFYDFTAGLVYMWNDPTGAPVDTLPFTQDLLPNNDPLAIGSWFRNDPNSPSIKDFNGRMDDVRISGRREDIFPASTGIASRHPGNSGQSSLTADIFPNPLSLSRNSSPVSIRVNGAVGGTFTIRIFNLLGQKVLEQRQYLSQGSTVFRWNLRDARGNAAPPGMYFAAIEKSSGMIVRKFLIIR